MDKSIWFIIVVSWIFNLFYVGTIFFMMFYSVIDSIHLMIK